jgi:MFS family permease
MWADRLDRRKLMVASDLIRAVLALGLILVRTPDQIWLVYVLTALLRGVTAFFGPAQKAAIPNLVKPEELLPANVLVEITWGAMLAIGAALGGLVSAFLGRDAAFIINSLSFLSSALLIASMRGRFAEAHPTGRRLSGGGWGEMWAGVDYARRHLPVAAFLMVKTGWALGAGVILLLSIFATQVFHAGDMGIGWLYAGRGLGVLIGPYLAALLVGASLTRMRWSVTIGYLINGLGYIAFSQSSNLALAALMVFFAHLGSGATWVLSSTMLQLIVPDHLRGRVFSLDNALVTLSIALSTWLVGIAVPVYGPRLVCVVVASVALVGAVAWTLLLVTNGERVNTSVPAEASGE